MAAIHISWATGEWEHICDQECRICPLCDSSECDECECRCPCGEHPIHCGHDAEDRRVMEEELYRFHQMDVEAEIDAMYEEWVRRQKAQAVWERYDA